MDPRYNLKNSSLFIAVCLSTFALCLARPSSGWDHLGTPRADSRGATVATEAYQSRSNSARGRTGVHKHGGDHHAVASAPSTNNELPPGPGTSVGGAGQASSPAGGAVDTSDRETTLLVLESDLWSRLEPRLRTMRQDIVDELNERMSRLNNSITIDFLYNVYHYLIEEVEVGKRIGEMRAEEIEKVRRVVIGQGKDIVKLERDVSGLQETVKTMSQAIAQLQGKMEQPFDSPPVPSTPSPPPPTLRPTSVVKPQFPTDCQAIYELGGMKFEGDYYMTIQPYLSAEPFEVHCRVHDNAGWLVIQRRMDGSTDFYRNWDTYKNGFGDLQGEFWLGNDHIFQLTNQGDYKLRIQMSDFDGRNHYAEYDHFRVLDEDHLYQMHVHGYHGDAGDSLTPSWNNHDGQPFSTFDRDHDERYYDNCAESFHGAWWFKSCFESHLNGLYYHKGQHDNYFKQNGIQWNTVGHHYSLRTVIMMIKPNENFKHQEEEEEVSNQIQ